MELFSFSKRPSKEYSRPISFRIDWFHLLAVQGTLKRVPTPQFKSINSLVFSLLYDPILTSIHDYWKNHSFNSMDLCRQSNVSAFEYAAQFGHSFSSKEQTSFHFTGAFTISGDFGAQEKRSLTFCIATPSISYKVMGPGAMMLGF